MKYLILFISVFGAIGTAFAQANCTPRLEYTVATASGLKMREGPGTNFKVVEFVPAKSDVLVCEELATPATYEGNVGHWRRVRYKNLYGYMFDGFLKPVQQAEAADIKNFELTQLTDINQLLNQDFSRADSILRFLNQVAKTVGYETLVGMPKADIDSLYWQAQAQQAEVPAEETPTMVDSTATLIQETPIAADSMPAAPLNVYKLLTEVSNYCGDIRDIDPGKIWYAIHRNGPYFTRSRVDIEILKSKYSIGKGLEFDIRSARTLEVAFFMSSENQLDTNWRVELPYDYFVANPNKLFPGQQTELYAYEPLADVHNITLFATGSVLEVGLCPVLEKYAIKATGEMNDQLIVQDLTPHFTYMGQCGLPEIYWFGDINGDLYPEVIFVSVGDEGTLFTLFMSNTAQKEDLYYKADEWFNKTCE